jgi:hypothetical protein
LLAPFRLTIPRTLGQHDPMTMNNVGAIVVTT